jgi:hypothetical protein
MTLPATETVVTLVADELAVTVPEALLAVRMALDWAATVNEVGATTMAVDAATVTATLTRPDRPSRTVMVVRPAPLPNTVKVALDRVTFESVAVATAVLLDCAAIDPLAPLIRAMTYVPADSATVVGDTRRAAESSAEACPEIAHSDNSAQVVNARKLLKAAGRAIVIFITVLLIRCQSLDGFQTASVLALVPQRCCRTHEVGLNAGAFMPR